MQLDEAAKLVDTQLSLPIPGRKMREKDAAVVAEQEMDMFKTAQATMGR